MKKIFAMVISTFLIFFMMFGMVACHSVDNDTPPPLQGEQSSESDTSVNNGSVAESQDIRITIRGTGMENEVVLNAILNDSAPAQSLKSQLPLSVTLNDSDNDFCGGNLQIDYSSDDVQYGYRNGDLAFWTPANNFVIFVSDEETSQNTGNLVILGRITDDLTVFENGTISGSITVLIELADRVSEPSVPDNGTEANSPSDTDGEQESPDTGSDDPQPPAEIVTGEYRVRISFGETVLYATFYDNATTRALREMLPLELPMMDLYGREMCYRFSDALPTDNAYSRGYEVGEIVYYPPMHSFVIMYEQNGEHFQMQSIGKIESGVEVFESIGDVTVRIEIID
ncbi:MAG: cyclophilin-like fold protein [Ruminococcus flavefaciens]|nr:cyclophilin-like fold protein [Ruminococcus flavefaciens]